MLSVKKTIRKVMAFSLTIILLSAYTSVYAEQTVNAEFNDFEVQTAVIDDRGAFVSSTARNIPTVIEEKRIQAEEERKRQEEEQRKREEAEFFAKYGETPTQQKERILKSIKAVEIEATATKRADIYSNGKKSKKLGEIKYGEKLIYIDHIDEKFAYIRSLESGIVGYVEYSAVRVSTKNYTVKGDFENSDKDAFVKLKGYTSDTDYLVWVNIERQKVNVFMNKGGRWCIEKVFTCATGANITRTPTGEYLHTAKSKGWYNKPEYYVKPVLYIDTRRGLAFHSILYNHNGTVQDATLGRPVSHGCIRMAQSDIDWMYNNIPINTKVVVW